MPDINPETPEVKINLPGGDFKRLGAIREYAAKKSGVRVKIGVEGDKNLGQAIFLS